MFGLETRLDTETEFLSGARALAFLKISLNFVRICSRPFSKFLKNPSGLVPRLPYHCPWSCCYCQLASDIFYPVIGAGTANSGSVTLTGCVRRTRRLTFLMAQRSENPDSKIDLNAIKSDCENRRSVICRIGKCRFVRADSAFGEADGSV
jgi:hypothetical protein